MPQIALTGKHLDVILNALEAYDMTQDDEIGPGPAGPTLAAAIVGAGFEASGNDGTFVLSSEE